MRRDRRDRERGLVHAARDRRELVLAAALGDHEDLRAEVEIERRAAPTSPTRFAAAATWGEFIIGGDHFNVGGLVVLPYVIPIAIFSILLIYGMKKSI